MKFEDNSDNKKLLALKMSDKEDRVFFEITDNTKSLFVKKLLLSMANLEKQLLLLFFIIISNNRIFLFSKYNFAKFIIICLIPYITKLCTIIIFIYSFTIVIIITKSFIKLNKS